MQNIETVNEFIPKGCQAIQISYVATISGMVLGAFVFLSQLALLTKLCIQKSD